MNFDMVGKDKAEFNKLSPRQMLDTLIDGAIFARASYIHIEPRSLDVLVRYRVDGSLVEVNNFPKKRFDSLVERIKIVSNLETRARNIIQDGRFKIVGSDSCYIFRVSIMPTIDGEKISINLLNEPANPLSLEKLGYWGKGLKTIKEALERKSGLILLSGNRDSGKSLSIYSMISNISTTNQNIATIEDPVEHKLPNANQIEINHRTKLGFETALKILDKHDYDIIMISDLRDSKTIKTVFNYSSRGKLIISSIYANNIFEVINKILDAGVSRQQIVHSLNVISQQRLVKRLCSNCKQSYTPTKTELSLVYKMFSLNNPVNMRAIHNLELSYFNELNDLSVKNSESLSSTENRIKKLWKPSEAGCETCQYSGYSGRLGVFEIINISPAIEKLILTLASPKVLLAKAATEGSINVFVDGLVKSLQGQTSINEIFKLDSLNL